MAVYSTYADTPERIIEEGRSITMTLNRTSPTTATANWTLPVSDFSQLAYYGMVVVLDIKEIGKTPDPHNLPCGGCGKCSNCSPGLSREHREPNLPRPYNGVPHDGHQYVGDPTADRDLFAGDRIGTALVVGAFYNDTTTLSLNITGLDPDTVYFVAGFAVDNVLRYHQEGVHTYAQTYGSQPLPKASPGWQKIELDIQPTDLTGFKSGTTYQLPLAINKPLRKPNNMPHGLDEFDTLNFPGGGPIVPSLDDQNIINVVLGENDIAIPHESRIPTIVIIFDGAVALTWVDFVKEINRQLALMCNPTVGFDPPNTGSYYYNPVTKELFIWNGYTLIQLTYIFDVNMPTAPGVGDYWVRTTDDTLWRWNGSQWIQQFSIALPVDPTDIPCETIWFDGTIAHIWDGTVWLPLETFIQSSPDPEAAPILTCGCYWFNTGNSTLYKWTDVVGGGKCQSGEILEFGQWRPISPILFPTDPTQLLIGDYWFDLKVNKVKTWNGVTWDIIANAVISTTQPINPALQQLWYNPTDETLQQWNGSAFIPVTVRVWDKDPANPPAGSVWWDTTTDLLYERNTLTNTWVQVTCFYDQAIDPSLPLEFAPNTVAWYDPVTKIMKIWDGSQWVVTQYINYPTDPSIIVDGVYWNNTTTGLWYIRQGGVWVQINPVFFPTAPTAPVAGEYWIDGSFQLWQWNGVAWVHLSYTTVNPAPKIGTEWFDSNTNTLMEWNGKKWIRAIPVAEVHLVPECPPNLFPFVAQQQQQFSPNPIQRVYDLLFVTGKLGAGTSIYVVPPSSFPSAEPFYIFDGNQLLVGARLFQPYSGSDPPPHYPQYRELGIGTDGSSAERREMIENVFYGLGYPSVQIELTKPNVEQAVTIALKELRRLSSSTYQRKFFFLNVYPNRQRYVLTDICQNFNTIHRVTAVRRRTSTFLGQAEGQAVYGQLVLQHLYQMGTFDLVSYHIISDYIKMMEILFANRVHYLWDEKTHTLDIFQTIRQPETMIIDCACERIEQDIFADRFLNTWLLNWAISEAELMLAGSRGKFQTLPGAGGGIALNAQDLRASAEKRQTRCLQEINDWIANSNLEEWGMEAEFTFG